MPRQKLQVDLSGPFFKKDITRTVAGAMKKIVQNVGTEAKKEYTSSLVKGRGRDSGAYKKTIRKKSRSKGRVYSATVFSTNPAIAMWLEGTGKLNQRSRFKGYALFKHAQQRTDAGAGREGRKLVAELTRQLGGT